MVGGLLIGLGAVAFLFVFLAAFTVYGLIAAPIGIGLIMAGVILVSRDDAAARAARERGGLPR
jgi:hypothetical protein